MFKIIQSLTVIFMMFCATACTKQAPPENNLSLARKVYKTPTCGCCGDWVSHIQESGFKTEVNNQSTLNPLKNELNIPPRIQSCHTAISDTGLFIEGHVPAKYIKQFLENTPSDALGIAVGGMPLGSPGMEVDNRFTPYDIVLLKKDGSTEIYAHIENIDQQYD